jgi:hypothetical protein
MKRFPSTRILAAGVAAAALLVFAAPMASAHTGTISIGCTEVDFSYQSFPSTGQNQIAQTVAIDGTTVASNTFDFTGSSATDTIPITVGPGTHTVTASATWSVDGGGHAFASKQVSGCGPQTQCPPGTSANFRWHYSANGSSGSWSGTKSAGCPSTLSTGPQAMEGDLKLAPGTVLLAGYDFTLPGNKATLTLTVNDPSVVFIVHCVSGAAPSAATFTVSMPTATYTVTNSDWYPSGDQHSSLVYQGSAAVPNLCGGGQVRLDKGGTFTATLS